VPLTCMRQKAIKHRLYEVIFSVDSCCKIILPVLLQVAFKVKPSLNNC
jgi:hypothetical protein